MEAFLSNLVFFPFFLLGCGSSFGNSSLCCFHLSTGSRDVRVYVDPLSRASAPSCQARRWCACCSGAATLCAQRCIHRQWFSVPHTASARRGHGAAASTTGGRTRVHCSRLPNQGQKCVQRRMHVCISLPRVTAILVLCTPAHAHGKDYVFVLSACQSICMLCRVFMVYVCVAGCSLRVVSWFEST